MGLYTPVSLLFLDAAWLAVVSLSYMGMFWGLGVHPLRSWVTAAGAVLDAAALTASTLQLPRDVQSDLCIRSGFVALRHIANSFRVRCALEPKPMDPTHVPRAEFNQAYEHLAEAGVPLKPDREQAWLDFAGWRMNYNAVLLALADITMAPDSRWPSDLPGEGGGLWLTRRLRHCRLPTGAKCGP